MFDAALTETMTHQKHYRKGAGSEGYITNQGLIYVDKMKNSL